MEGFEEAAVLLPSNNGLGYTGERKIEHKTPVTVLNPLDPHADLAQIRAEKRRREIEMMSMPVGRLGVGDEDAGDLDAAAARKDAASMGGGSGVRVSLREQLRLNKEASQAAWEEKHNPFKPPPGLDEEEYQAYLEQNQDREARHQQQREQEKHDYDEFAQALRRKEEAQKLAAASSSTIAAAVPVPLPDIATIDPSLSFSHLTPTSASASLLTHSSNSPVLQSAIAPISVTSLPPLVILKRKHSEGGKEKKEKKHSKKQKQTKSDTPSSAESLKLAESSAPAATSSANALAGLAAYSSEDDD